MLLPNVGYFLPTSAGFGFRLQLIVVFWGQLQSPHVLLLGGACELGYTLYPKPVSSIEKPEVELEGAAVLHMFRMPYTPAVFVETLMKIGQRRTYCLIFVPSKVECKPDQELENANSSRYLEPCLKMFFCLFRELRKHTLPIAKSDLVR